MHSTTTSAVADASELSKVARERAIQGQPTLSQAGARVRAEPKVQPEPRLSTVSRVPEIHRVFARPVMGQGAQAQGAPLSQDEARLIHAGLSETLRLADDARNTGWRCTGVDDATYYRGRVLRDRLGAYLAAPGNGAFTISKDEAEVADKILSCSKEATASSPNKGAYVALAIVVAGAAIFFSLAK